ncbi:DUF4982 domain-containing protein [Metabacillus halosaccharovorans]|uniref:DUF4982 domain-containing protein n=1 Tax=Metabacillus halosaccharovorans TaxID=930124 RepID=UPI001C1F3A10|nr:DUF4982 domain-containing protein [Metabacillus halosaccharovorans]
MVRVDIYSNADEVELRINGRSLGEKVVDDELKVSFDVNYTPGLIEAINYRNGMKAETDLIETCGEPYQIHLEVETENWGSANTEELKYINCSIVDHNGLLVPYAEHVINVEVSGTGELAGIGTGDPISEESYMELFRKAYNGKLLIVVRGKGEGETIVSARADGIGENFIELKMNGLKKSFEVIQE